jgi:hypothetical protein
MNSTPEPVIFHREWKRPKITVYKPADTRPRFGWNRYDTCTIGCGIVLFRRAWSLTWAKPRAEVLPR